MYALKLIDMMICVWTDFILISLIKVIDSITSNDYIHLIQRRRFFLRYQDIKSSNRIRVFHVKLRIKYSVAVTIYLAVKFNNDG